MGDTCEYCGREFIDNECACNDNIIEEYKVTFIARFEARVKIKPGQDLGDAVADIDIPENHQCFYVDGSFEPDAPEKV
jgi:hypothetical protein